MDFIDNLCMNCFQNIGDGNICPHCGFNNNSVLQDMTYLPLKTVLADRYIVGKPVSYESDAATYLGYDLERRSVVTIREFIPRGITNRLEGNLDVHVRERYKSSFVSYKSSFVQLWVTLKGLNNLSAVIPVLDVFEENETAYAVCEKMETLSLREFLLRSAEGNIMWDKARLMFMPVLTTIEKLHESGIIHGGISPDNLVLCRDGKIRLAGFCISECNKAGGELQFNVTDGYTALEQYDNAHRICPATDIYSFSACIYRALVGTNPPDAPSRETNDKLMIPNRIAEKIPAHVIKALGGGLQIRPENRIQSINDFREFLSAAPSVVAKAGESAPKQEVKPAVKETKPNDEELLRAREAKRKAAQEAERAAKKKRNTIIAIVAAVIVVLIAVGCGIGFSGILKPEETTDPIVTETVQVPNFCTAGYTESDIKGTASWNEQFKIQFKYEYATNVEKGIIFKQSIEPGETVNEGSEIILTVSNGIETVVVPDVGGLTKDEAIKKLEAAGLTVSVVYIYNDSHHTPETVKMSGGMAPKHETVVAKGEEVAIQVYGEEVTTTEPSTEPSTDGEQAPEAPAPNKPSFIH